MPLVDIAIVAVVSGDGLYEVFRSLGTTIVAPGGQTMNPSVRELAQAVESAPSGNIILLPNNKNIILTASQVEALTSKKVKVIPTKTIPQGIAALLAFNYEASLEENAQFMEENIARVKSLEITKAVRNARLNGLNIKKGQFIAILDDEKLVSNGSNASNVIFDALEKIDLEGIEVITNYYGAEAQAAEAEEIAQKIKDRYPVQVETICGRQPYYNYILSLE